VQECEKLLVAIDLAGWLNDSQIILQAVVQCYGLLAPLIYFNLAYDPIVQVKLINQQHRVLKVILMNKFNFERFCHIAY